MYFQRLRPLAALLLGFALIGWRLCALLEAQYPADQEGRDVQVLALIDSIPQARAPYVRFEIRVLEATFDGAEPFDFVGRRARLSWRLAEGVRAPAPGEVWQMTLRLKRPRGFANPQGWDYQAWLLAQGVLASGYVRNGERLPGARRWNLSRLRHGLDEALFAPGDYTFLPLLRALGLGLKGDISEAQWQVFQATGTSHLMAISGLHIGLMAWLGLLLGRAVTRLLWFDRLAWLSRLPLLCALIPATIYAALAGFALPTQRALLMVLAFGVAHWLHRRCQPLHVLLLAFVAVAWLNPMGLTQAGFWLSFAAVAALVMGLAGQRDLSPSLDARLGRWWRPQWVVFVGLLAVQPALQLPLSAVSPLCNAIAIPVVSLLVVPLVFLGMACGGASHWLGDTCFSVADAVLGLLWRSLEVSASLVPLHQGSALAPTALVAGLAATLLLVLPLALPWRAVGVALCVVIAAGLTRPAADWEVTVLDVGQGLSVVLQQGETALVYDTGAKFSADFDAGSDVVAPFLRAMGVSDVALTVISHGDNDHAGGLPGLMAQYPPRQLWANDPTLDGAEPCVAGRRWHFGDTTLEVLWPLDAEAEAVNRNSASCVVVVRRGSFTLLLSGDIDRTAETQLLAAGLLPRDVDVLIAPHHGSNTSSSAAFIRWLNPTHVIFSAGYKNRYRHPAAAVVERYRQQGAETWHTGEQGAIRLRLDAAGALALNAQREGQRRPW